MTLFDELAEVIGRTQADWIGKVAAADRVLKDFVVIPRRELPDVFESTNGNGICASAAQEFHQPPLYFHPSDGDVPGEWNRRIAYANLAVADAIDARNAAAAKERGKRRDELAAELAPRGAGLGENWYENVSVGLQRAIDRIIDMEEASK